MQRRFRQMDVFADGPIRGNPLAVVVDGEGLGDDEMSRFANWTNLSETTFLLPPTHPGADYRVRIFTTSTELPFAGHPTLGSCRAWLESGGLPRGEVVVQECAAGLVEIRRDGDRLAFAAPPLKRAGPLDEALLWRLLDGLDLRVEDVVDSTWIVNGPEWIGLQLESALRVLDVRPDFARLAGLDFGLVGAHPPGSDAAFEVRGFAYTDGPVEDPVTGSLNAGIAQWLIGRGAAPDSYVAAQGTALGRRGRVHIDRDADGRIWVGGAARTIVEGTVDL